MVDGYADSNLKVANWDAFPPLLLPWAQPCYTLALIAMLTSYPQLCWLPVHRYDTGNLKITTTSPTSANHGISCNNHTAAQCRTSNPFSTVVTTAKKLSSQAMIMPYASRILKPNILSLFLNELYNECSSRLVSYCITQGWDTRYHKSYAWINLHLQITSY